jgi:hypothetical protein
MGLTWKKLGKFALKAAPIAASFIPGVGPLAAAGIGAATGAIGKGKPKLSNILGGAAAGYGGAMAKGAMGAGGAASAASKGGFLSKVGSVGQKVLDNKDLILGGINMVQGARSQGRADQFAGQASALQKQRYDDTASLRAGAISRLTNTQRPNLDHVYGGSENAFARAYRPMSPSMGATTPPGPQAANPMDRPLRRVTQPGPMQDDFGGPDRRFV